MKKGSLFLIAVPLLLMALISLFGCGQSSQDTTTTTTASTTTTLTSGAAAGSAAQDAVNAAIGVSQTSQNIGVMAGAGGSVRTSSINSGPPSAFFAPLPSDGWITVEGANLTTGETIRVRLYTRGGDVINAAYLAAKKIATLEGFSWDSMSAGGAPDITTFFGGIYLWINYSTDWDPADPVKRAAFYSLSNKFYSCSSLWNYIVWANVAGHPSTEAAVNPAYIFYPTYNFMAAALRSPLASYPKLATPEATSNDKIGTQEARITGTHADGSTIDITQSVSTDAAGKPVSVSGHGTIVRANGVVMTINSMTMTFSGGAPASGTVDITVGSPDNLHMVMTTTGTGAASGDVYSTATSPETKVGTVVIFAVPDASGHKGYFEDVATGTKTYF